MLYYDSYGGCAVFAYRHIILWLAPVPYTHVGVCSLPVEQQKVVGPIN